MNPLKEELEALKIRIENKIRTLVFTQKKLPFERLAKGRQLKELVIMAIKAIDDGDQKALNEYIEELKSRSIEITKYGRFIEN
ncbi:hypothetical protein [Mongoliitalea lutea]|uniref:Uncharacterized protein n=1 Tax=Mongoliitalea lutea TaxID=849756 RepID=A0A8J3CXG8_9BACT|nr:hypothetical protein [Mongoliitalea lutea]GHB44280.1 hypothetical protein GCM10008106_26630 [Mongoliitalea lutea]